MVVNCPPGKILNPATGKCVLITGAIGKKLVAKASDKRPVPTPSRGNMPSSRCPADKIFNPATGKCVLRRGVIGKKLVAKERANGKRPVDAVRSTPRNGPSERAGEVCPDDKIFNPATGKCVLRTGAIGKKLIAAMKRRVNLPGEAGPSRPDAAPSTDPRVVISRSGESFTLTGETDAVGHPVVVASNGRKLAWIAATKSTASRYVASRTGTKYVNMETKNALGRPIVKGPRGGLYAWSESTRTVSKPSAITVGARRPPASRPSRPSRPRPPVTKRWITSLMTVSYPKISTTLNRSSTKNVPFDRLIRKMNHIAGVYNMPRLPAPGTPSDVPSGPLDGGINEVISGNVVATRRRNIDPSWFERQAEYISGLSDYDLMTVISYTVRSHMWLGPYQRNGRLPSARNLNTLKPSYSRVLPVPLFPQMRAVTRGMPAEQVFEVGANPREKAHFMGDNTPLAYQAHVDLFTGGAIKKEVVRAAIELFVRDLKRIVAGAPPVETPIVVYRGTSDDVLKGVVPGRTYQVDAFSSAAFDLRWAMKYAGGSTGLIQRITLPRGSRVIVAAMVNLWAPEGEYEVILPPGSYEVAAVSQSKRTVSNGIESLKKVANVVFRS